MTINNTISRSDNFVFNEVDGELVMMNIETGAYASMNETGKSIWTMLDEPKTIDSVIITLMEEYEIDRAACEADVLPFIENLAKAEILNVA